MRVTIGQRTPSMRNANPAPTCDPKTCKWICLPMPTPNDPHDLHCVAVPRAARLRGAFVTTGWAAPRRMTLLGRYPFMRRR